MTSLLESLIIVTVEKSGEVRGVETLSLELGCANRSWFYKLLKRLEDDKLLKIVHTGGGRGCKNIIKRNRNCAGMPRKVRV